MAETRRTVTVVFADLSGSTSLGEDLDPEALRSVLTRYFDALRTALEHHDGVVEKYIGDAVMAVFGLSAIHEDDALRAVRAAAEARERLQRLGEEIETELGAALGARIGVNTGEVIAGEGNERQQLVTGDAVNVAARLEQAASPGEILLGAETIRLVRDAVRVEELEPLELKGKAEPVAAFRLLDVLPDAPAFTRRLDAPFVGRRSELADLLAAFDRCVAADVCERVTILGEPGIGKSRLVRELVNGVDRRARVLVGRCLSYGEGITYWPLSEIVQQVAGADVPTGLVETMSEENDAELVASTIAGALGHAEEAASTEDTHWAVRRLLETLAGQRPVVVVVDDLHWAEPTMLDLLEYVTAFAQAVPILIVGVARPEVVESRPSLGMPGPRSTILRLEPLGAAAAEELVTALRGRAAVSAGRRDKILERAEGNPLFVEQMLAMEAESSDKVEVPPTIQALLAARIDRLEPGERAVIQCGAIEGRLFHRHAVMELAPEELGPSVGAHLLSLVRKQLVRPDRALFPGDDGFRFAHALVREAAYEAAPKEARAALHERYAAWLEGMTSGSGEPNEIVAYHLEQAARFNAQLGRADRELERRAGERLGDAGLRALERGDIPAAVNLIERARELLPPEEGENIRFGLRLIDAYLESGRFVEADALSTELVTVAGEANDPVLAVASDIERMLCRLEILEVTAEEAIAAGRAALPALEESGDDEALGRAWRLIVHGYLMLAQYEPMASAAEHALGAARRSGDARTERELLFWLSGAQLFGPIPVDEGLAQCERVVPDPQERVILAHKLHWRGGLQAFAGRSQGVTEIEEARAIYRDLGLTLRWAGTSIAHAIGELAVGHPERAGEVLRESLEVLDEIGEKGYLSTIAYCLADALLLQERLDEAEKLTRVSEAATAPDDIASLVGWRRTRSLVLARLGELDEAEQLARQAVVFAERSDSLMQLGDVALALATVLERLGRTNEATIEARRAADFYARKGMDSFAARARALVSALA